MVPCDPQHIQRRSWKRVRESMSSRPGDHETWRKAIENQKKTKTCRWGQKLRSMLFYLFSFLSPWPQVSSSRSHPKAGPQSRFLCLRCQEDLSEGGCRSQSLLSVEVGFPALEAKGIQRLEDV